MAGNSLGLMGAFDPFAANRDKSTRLLSIPTVIFPTVIKLLTICDNQANRYPHNGVSCT